MDGLRDRRQQKHARKVASTRGVEDGAVDKIDGAFIDSLKLSFVCNSSQ
jgi:hypothetical protein